MHPHRVPYYLQRKDPHFDDQRVQVLHVYQQVTFACDPVDHRPTVRWSYDEKPGIQARRAVAPDLPPPPGVPDQGTWERDYEYQRLGTRTLLAGIDLATGEVLGLVRARHRSREFVEWLQALDAKYDAQVKIQVVLDNHSAHVSKETRRYLATKPNRFELVFTPAHASWLNRIEMFFAKLSKHGLRGIRLDSAEELEIRLQQFLGGVTTDPGPFRWQGRLESADPAPPKPDVS